MPPCWLYTVGIRATQSLLVLKLPEVCWHWGCTETLTFTFTSSSRIALLYFCIYKYVMMIINNVSDIAANGATYKVWLLGTFINPNQYLSPLTLLSSPSIWVTSFYLTSLPDWPLNLSTPKSCARFSGSSWTVMSSNTHFSSLPPEICLKLR